MPNNLVLLHHWVTAHKMILLNSLLPFSSPSLLIGLHLLGHLLCLVPWFRAVSCLPLVRAQESAIRAGAGGRWDPPCGGTWPVWVRKWLRESHRLAMWCWSRLQFFCSACRRLSINSKNREARNADLAETPGPISLCQPYHKSTPLTTCISNNNWHCEHSTLSNSHPILSLLNSYYNFHLTDEQNKISRWLSKLAMVTLSVNGDKTTIVVQGFWIPESPPSPRDRIG